MRQCDHDDRRHHEHAGGDDRAWLEPRYAANAVARRAAAAKPAAETD